MGTSILISLLSILIIFTTRAADIILSHIGLCLHSKRLIAPKMFIKEIIILILCAEFIMVLLKPILKALL